MVQVRKAGIPADPRLEGMEKGSVKYELLKIVYEGDYIRDQIKAAGLSTYMLTAEDKAAIKVSGR